MKKLVFSFGSGKADGRMGMKDTLGGKGAGLAEMSRAGVPVPPGFTISTDVCRSYSKDPKKGLFGTPGLKKQFDAALAKLEKAAGRRLGDAENPLLVAVRSGAKFSMPGMMDTILNLGLSAPCVEGLAKLTGDLRFALDSRRRFIQMFGNVVCGVDKDKFERRLKEALRAAGKESESDLGPAELKNVVERFLQVYREETGDIFPEDPREQLERAVAAVFKSWMNPRAVTYRKANNIPASLGTACNVQAMVFGNLGADSGTGVGFTRNPSTGAKEFYGEFLSNAQGEDVVAGIRTPHPLADLKKVQPKVHSLLKAYTSKLEKRYRDMQDFEFTYERKKLYLLQTRTAKRTALSALAAAVDMVKEKLIRPEEAVLRVSPEALEQLLKPVFNERARRDFSVLAKGLPAGPGAAAGRIVFSADEAVAEAAKGPVILVRAETNPDDIHGMMAAKGILTATGGMTSHAAVVGRGMGKVCVVGCGALDIGDGELRVNGTSLKAGDFLSLDGFKGEVLVGEVPTQPSEILQVLAGEMDPKRSKTYGIYDKFMGWADDLRTLGVRANADRPEEARIARLLGAAGIGLCRTEHMFFGDDRIAKMLAMIVADTPEDGRKAVDALFPLQRQDFTEILREMRGLPVTFRSFDPPLHEFLPRTYEEAQKRGKAAGVDPDKIWRASKQMHEQNPMLGHRGCRLGVTHPEITAMQARAMLAAARDLTREGVQVEPEFMIPLVGTAAELKDQAAVVRAEAADVLGKDRVAYKVGTMIEVPRAAFAADEIAREAEFFSFGTNDLTQMLLGYSRDDYGRFIGVYLDKGVFAADPFQTIDREGVGAAVALAVEKARKVKKGMKLGICGEHGGDPASIEFFHAVGLDYVSCSPYRVPLARLAAAQSAIRATPKRRKK